MDEQSAGSEVNVEYFPGRMDAAIFFFQTIRSALVEINSYLFLYLKRPLRQANFFFKKVFKVYI